LPVSNWCDSPFKGTVARDFRPLVFFFFINRPPYRTLIHTQNFFFYSVSNSRSFLMKYMQQHCRRTAMSKNKFQVRWTHFLTFNNVGTVHVPSK
jgi:hypothetical protein